MKIKPEDLAVLRERVAPCDTPQRRAKYADRAFPRADKVQDINKRYRWDLLWMSGLKIGDREGVGGELALYAYLKDSHIDTALRTIVPDLE